MKAVILGIVQGLTEFIPISSSGHLIAIRQTLGWHDAWLDKTFDVALHIGTLVALVAFFWRDWVKMLRSLWAHVVGKTPYEQAADGISGRMVVPILIACIPAAIVGYKWDEFFEKTLSQWYYIAPPLVGIALVMLLADRIGRKARAMGEMGYADYLTIGCAQALALFPGVSRSGITITAGLFRGLDRFSAAQFSFLLSMPIVLGAGLKKLKDITEVGLPASQIAPFAIGFLAAAVSGYLAIRFLLNFLQKRSLNAFVIYRIAFAALMAAVLWRAV